MDIVGISDDEQVCLLKFLFLSCIFTSVTLVFMFDQEAIFRTLAGILHLGNIEFSPGKEHDSSVVKDQKSNFHLEMAAELFRFVTLVLLSLWMAECFLSASYEFSIT